jgi:hypothetical protein
MRLVGGPPELAYLRDGGGADRPATLTRVFEPQVGRVKVPMLRRIARMLSWTRPWLLPAALIAPDAVAVSHNPLLVRFARDEGACVGFGHASLLLNRLRMAAGSVAPVIEVAPLAHRLAQVLTMEASLDPAARARLLKLTEAVATQFLTRAATDLAVLRRWRRPPRALWSGTGGYYPARALGLEVLRRGGTVTRFSHGGGAGMSDTVEPLALGELAVSSKFVVGTPDIAANIETLGGPRLVAKIRQVEVVGHTGAPQFGKPSKRVRRRPGSRPRVIYTLTHLRGFRVGLPPFLPDMVYLDWQFRLTSGLLKIPIDLLCQTHPEEELDHPRHPLADLAPMSTKRFEEVMGEADLFLFDWSHSTTFWKALCTDRPVVYVDFGLSGFAPGVSPLIERRCRVVPATYDSNNLPQVDASALADAILAGPTHADGSPFRRLLGGRD